MKRSSKRLAIRGIRKGSHVANRVLSKTHNFTKRVENKATRILDGTDFSVKLHDTAPLEKIYYSELKPVLPINPALPKLGQKASVVLFLPSLQNSSFFGGTATALIVAGRLAEMKKMPLSVVQTLQTGQPGDLAAFFAKEGIGLTEDDIAVSSVAERAYNFYGYLPMHKDDIFVASAWWDAYLIDKLPLNKKFIYLVQDFEPIFYNNSDQYVLAESTYKMNSFIPLCNTKLMYDFMRERKYSAFLEEQADYFEPAVSRAKSGLVTEKAGGKKRLLLYGRPSVHRNLFFTALEAIEYSFKADFLNKDEWELYVAGQDNLPNIKLSNGVTVTNLGKMSMEEYVKFSKTVDLALSPMMAPHPNYPTLEFASIGSAVVTTKYANKTDLSKYSKNIVMSEIDVESLAGAIKLAAEMPAEARLKNVADNNIEGDWHESLDAKLHQLIKSLEASEKK